MRHFNVPLASEPFIQVKRSFYIGAGVVTSFGYRKELDGSWVKKDVQPQPANECIPSPPRHDSSMLLNDILTELRSLRAHFDDRLDRIDTHFEEMDIRIDQLADDMSYICRYFDLPADP